VSGLLIVALVALAVAAGLAVALVRERRRAREAEQARERARAELQRFASVASHDLAEPLRTVSGFAGLVAERYESRLDATGEMFLRYIVDGTHSMQRLLDGMATWARVGRDGTGREPVELDDVLRRVVHDLDARIDETEATVLIGDLPTVLGDRTQLTELFQNLVANALKFTGEDPPYVAVDAEREEDGWRIVVADRGPGVPADRRDEIFGMFARGRGAEAGTGVGLAVCAKIAENHDGKIRVEANPDGGSLFVVQLPNHAR
jgi:light-regulated signal transduction histidine kinase (bacteriophytochrome)